MKLVKEGIKDVLKPKSKEDIENTPIFKSFKADDKLIRQEFNDLVISGKFNTNEPEPFWILDISGEFDGQPFGEIYISMNMDSFYPYTVSLEGGSIIYNNNSLEIVINKIKETFNVNESVFKPKSTKEVKELPEYKLIMDFDRKIRHAFPNKVSKFYFETEDPYWELDLIGYIDSPNKNIITGGAKGNILIQFLLEPNTLHGYFEVFFGEADVDSSEDIDDIIKFIKNHEVS